MYRIKGTERSRGNFAFSTVFLMSLLINSEMFTSPVALPSLSNVLILNVVSFASALTVSPNPDFEKLPLPVRMSFTIVDESVFRRAEELKALFEQLSDDIGIINGEYELVLDMAKQFKKLIQLDHLLPWLLFSSISLMDQCILDTQRYGLISFEDGQKQYPAINGW